MPENLKQKLKVWNLKFQNTDLYENMLNNPSQKTHQIINYTHLFNSFIIWFELCGTCAIQLRLLIAKETITHYNTRINNKKRKSIL